MDEEYEIMSDTATSCNFPSASEIISDMSQAKREALEKKAVHLRLVLEKDFKAADMKWSLFVSAAFSFRYESCLRPFPSAYIKNGIKDMDELLSVITDVPALDLVLMQLNNLEYLPSIGYIIDLLFYVLVRLKEPSLKTLSPEEHDELLSSYASDLNGPKPQYIFQVCYSNKSTSEAKWRELEKNHSTFFGYHGNRLENFYSIMNFGLQTHMKKNNVLGNGIYLSTDFNISRPFSHGGYGWGASCIGGHLSCVAMCEVIDAPEGINYKRLVSNEGDVLYEDEKTVKSSGSPNPNTQYIVTNCDLVRLRYLLVYAKQPASIRVPVVSPHGRNGGGVRDWLSRHKLFSILLGYGLMLATIGFANNQPMNYYYNVLLKKMDLAYNTLKL